MFLYRAIVRLLVSILVLTSVSGLLISCGSYPSKSAKSSKSKKNKNKRYYNIEQLIYSTNTSSPRSSSRSSHRSYRRGGKNFDIPVRDHPRVRKWVAYFSGRGRSSYSRWLSRSGRYFPLYYQMAKRIGVPQDLVFLSMIESGLNTRATSHASAAGPWQFIRSTGAMYGLNGSSYIDERRDLYKSTNAAMRHLKDLHNEFGDWELAFAAYNAGSGKVRRAIQKYGTRNYWKLIDAGPYLKPETKDYVAKIYAAAIVAKNLDRYGFKQINYQSPLKTEKVRVNRSVSLSVIAQAAGINKDIIYLINPELYRGVTPPRAYSVNVPMGLGRKVKRQLPKMARSYRPSYKKITHRVRRGESIYSIARKYGVSSRDLIAQNRSLKNKRSRTKLRKGQRIYISKAVGGWSQRGASFRDDRAALLAKRTWATSSGSPFDYRYAGRNSRSNSKPRSILLASVEDKKRVERQSKKAIRKSVRATEVKKVASLDLSRRESSEKLRVVNAAATDQDLFDYPVASASVRDTGRDRSQDVSQDKRLQQAVKRLGNQASKKVSHKRVATKGPVQKKQKQQVFRYKVRKGDNLTVIARKYKVSIADLKKMNSLKTGRLRSGQVLKIKGKARVQQSRPQSKPRRLYATYLVKKGDTLSSIARRNRTTVKQLMRLNKLRTTRVRVGARLKVSKS